MFLLRRFTFCLVLVTFAFPMFAKTSAKYNEECIANPYYTPFVTKVVPDTILLATSAATVLSSFALQEYFPRPEWDGKLRDKNSINFLDGICFNPYSKTLDTVGTVTCAINMAVIPITAFAFEAINKNLPNKELLNISIMYAESCLFAYGAKNILKVFAARNRPYTYFEDIDESALDNHDFMQSFPSGHSTYSFMSAGFISYVFSEYYPESRYKPLIYAASYSAAVATAALRVASGNHFLTDVAAGAFLGTVIGIGVPALHHLMADHQYDRTKSFNISPNGVSATIYF